MDKHFFGYKRGLLKYYIHILYALVEIWVCSIGWHVVIVEACKVERAAVHLHTAIMSVHSASCAQDRLHGGRVRHENIHALMHSARQASMVQTSELVRVTARQSFNEAHMPPTLPLRLAACTIRREPMNIE